MEEVKMNAEVHKKTWESARCAIRENIIGIKGTVMQNDGNFNRYQWFY